MAIPAAMSKTRVARRLLRRNHTYTGIDPTPHAPYSAEKITLAALVPLLIMSLIIGLLYLRRVRRQRQAMANVQARLDAEETGQWGVDRCYKGWDSPPETGDIEKWGGGDLSVPTGARLDLRYLGKGLEKEDEEIRWVILERERTRIEKDMRRRELEKKLEAEGA
ncbi:hypothetical protein DFP73DRAFT_583678 [Morchella snyderi]|nr:hypothetical protein DFP73DRAFT_583678 [Morchella snyderi]